LIEEFSASEAENVVGDRPTRVFWHSGNEGVQCSLDSKHPTFGGQKWGPPNRCCGAFTMPSLTCIAEGAPVVRAPLLTDLDGIDDQSHDHAQDH